MPAQPPRLQRLFDHAPDLDAVLLVNGPPDASFFWATGLHTAGTFEGSLALLRPDQAPVVLTSQLEETTARKSDNEVLIYQDKDDRWAQLASLVGSSDRVGVDLSKLPVEGYRTLQEKLDVAGWEDASEAIQHARGIKDPGEIEAIRAACQLTDRLADEMEAYVSEATTEAELAAELVRAMLAQGAKTSFDPIVACGPGAAEPHYSPSQVRLEDGFLLVDMGCKLAGYCSDITRTYSLGDPPAELERMHAVVLEAQQAALDAIQPGKTGAEIHQAAARVIDESPYNGRFIHSTGHTLGVEVHDGGPGLTSKSEGLLEPGMVFTVEPGVYVPDVGGVRIEEDIVVTEAGCERLTQADRALRDVRG